MTLGSRREARERALSLLYEAEVKDLSPQAILDEQPVTPDPFVIELVGGVGTRRDDIDGLIERYAIDWTLERMPSIDRNVLRIAVYELLARADVPVGAIISEAVELAKRYSTDDSGRFINGLLANVAIEVRPG